MVSELELWKALKAGLADFLKKHGFPKVLLGLSGGLDSAIVATLAAEVVGPENVLGVMMPSPYSSKGSIDDSLELALNLGIKTIKISIEPLMREYEKSLSSAFLGYEKDVTEENIQSRIRGTILMALSNKFKAMLLATGNKSEVSVGYCTLYGDTCGGVAPIADVYKTTIYKLARWKNKTSGRDLIPEKIIAKAPSAELKENQTDQDTLPPYEILDEILERHLDKGESADEIIKSGRDPEMVGRVFEMIKCSEFKRRQLPPAIQIGKKK